ncbi:peptidase S41-like protein [Sphingomonas sp. PP-CE-3A-406]|uniref:S41 family peptidase n=1 Tax=Sphingomonas sp. PP-CE-3A-406 TaxID=2135659 RepID=UPI000EF876B6|nr:S41 family peptidase [Sphingomonas sp. PP-CE-3A-406]RMB54833.1 peptidase S41-like protein [Sphingomonas sp. PP-CE-3A-406]
MPCRRHALMLLLPFLALSKPPSAGAQTATASATPARTSNLEAAARTAIVARLSTELRSRYIYPVVGEKGAAAITAAAASGAYDRIVDLPAFATRLTEDLRGVMTDKHLMVFNTTNRPASSVASMPAGEAGIVRADRLPGGIGYLQIDGFANPRAFKPALDRAMAGLKGSRALILDMRGNGGGDPASVSYLVSYLLSADKRTKINSMVERKAGTTELRRDYFFSEPTSVSFAGVSAYVLTSSDTFSGGEELAYDMQTLKLGTVVGEVTGGGANPGERISIGHGVMAFIPTGRAESPVTGSNWEGRGVQPDLKVPAADALATTLRRLGQVPAGATIEAASPVSVFAPRTVALKGGEAMLHRLFAGRTAPEADYTLMKPDASEAGRAALAATHRRLQPLGIPQAIRFRRPDGFGFDEFTLVYPDRTLLVGIMLDSDGKFIDLIGPDPSK